MATWYDYYTITNKSLHGNTYVTAIKYTSETTVTELQPAAVPFEFQVDNSTDIDTTLRCATGTLRFINNGELENLTRSMTDMKYMVECTYGEKIVFRGYLGAEELTQPWDGTPYEVELPVIDMLSALELVNVDPSISSITPLNFATYLLEAMEAVDHDFTYVILPSDLEAGSTILDAMIQREWYESETVDDSTGAPVIEGITWKEAFEKTLKPYGYSLQTFGTYLVFQSVNPTTTQLVYTKAEVQALADGDEVTPSSLSSSVFDIEEGFVNMSASNRMSVLPPYKRVLVKQQLDEKDVDGQVEDDYITSWSHEWGSYSNQFYYFRALTEQPNLTLYRHYIDSTTGAAGDEVEESTVTYAVDSTGIIGGAVLGMMQSWTDDSSMMSLDSLSASLWLSGGTGGLRPGSTGNMSSYVKALQIRGKYPIRAYALSGALCITGTLQLCSSTQPDTPLTSPTSDMVLMASLQLTDDIFWTSSYGWLYDTDYSGNPSVFPITFAADTGEIVPNTYENDNTHGVTLGERLALDGASGMIFPLERKSSWTTLDICTPTLTLYTPYGYDSDQFFVLENFQLKYVPAFLYQHIWDTDEWTAIYETGASAGKDLSIDLESWYPILNVKYEARTVQPALPMWSQDHANELKYGREVVELENARQQIRSSESDTFHPWDLYTYADTYTTKKYLCVGRTFNTSTDSGNVTLLQYRNLYTE